MNIRSPVLILLALLPSSSAHADPKLIGLWKFTERGCLSGAKPAPSELRSNAQIRFSESDMTLFDSADGCKFTIGPVGFKVQSGKIIPAVEQAPIHRACGAEPSQIHGISGVLESGYSITGDTLKLTAQPSPKDGVCAEGDSPVVEFVRAK